MCITEGQQTDIWSRVRVRARVGDEVRVLWPVLHAVNTVELRFFRNGSGATRRTNQTRWEC